MEQKLSTGVKLNGANWVVWKFQTSVMLKGEGVFDFVSGEKLKPTSGEKETAAWEKNDAKAQQLIVTRMEEGPLTHILSCETACEMWSKLKSVYDKESVVSIHLLQQKFFLMDFQGESVSSYISKIEEIRNELKKAGGKVIRQNDNDQNIDVTS